MSRDKELRQVAKELAYNNFTWVSICEFNKEEHKLIDKYIKEYELQMDK